MLCMHDLPCMLLNAICLKALGQYIQFCRLGLEREDERWGVPLESKESH